MSATEIAVFLEGLEQAVHNADLEAAQGPTLNVSHSLRQEAHQTHAFLGKAVAVRTYIRAMGFRV